MMTRVCYRLLMLCMCVLAASCSGTANIADESSASGDTSVAARVNKLMYHNDRQRTGWNRNERVLTRAAVSSSQFGPIWESPQLDGFDGEAPRLFASPLFVDRVELSTPAHAGTILPVVYAASGTGYVYGISAGSAEGVSPGTVLWSRRLTTNPCRTGRMGILGTPVIDLHARRLYVTTCDTKEWYKAHALDLANGEPVPGWPADINHVTVNRPGINKNGATQFPDKTLLLQRGALNLNWDGTRLYVPFGKDSVSGWMVVIDTTGARIHSAFSSTAVTAEHQGGMWSTSGPSIDPEGRVHVATGASVVFTTRKAGIAGVFPDSEHNWGQSIMQWRDDSETGLALSGTYTPFDYCRAQAADVDLGSSGTIVLDLDPEQTSTPRLLALVGGKQGNAFLLDRDRMPGSLIKRPGCSDDSTTDQSLLAPDPQPHFQQRGPLNVFGPYSAELGWYDYAKSRSTASYFRDRNGANFLYATGNTKAAVDSVISVPPGLARLRVVTQPGQPAYLVTDMFERTLVLKNPGSPIISSNGHEEAIVWVLDMNASTTVSLWDEKNPPQPVLYAFDAESLKLLWKSTDGQLATSGVYNEPAIVNGMVLVGTDRIHAFGLR